MKVETHSPNCQKIRQKKDSAPLFASCLGLFGGGWVGALCAGAFPLAVGCAFSFSYVAVGCHLLFSTIDFFNTVNLHYPATRQNIKNPVYLY